MARSVVLVHGAFHGRWCWERVVPRLSALGVAAVAPELPYTSWEDDVACVRAAIATAGGPVLLVGHSLGGGLVCEVGADPAVTALGFVSALVVAPGETIRERLTAAGVAEELRDGSNPEIGAAMRVGEDGRIALDPEAAAAIFFSDCTPKDAALAASRLRSISPSSLGGRPGQAPWRDKPANYLFCGEDQALADEVQEGYAAGLTGRQDRLTASHSPFWSRPDALAGVIADWAAAPDLEVPD
ncbi:alpha/beta hydrolase [Streptomyces sp. NPDC004227]